MHLFCSCDRILHERNLFWDKIIVIVTVEQSVALFSKPDEDIVDIFLGAKMGKAEEDSDAYSSFVIAVAQFVQHISKLCKDYPI